jgi:hypothetical protein
MGFAAVTVNKGADDAQTVPRLGSHAVFVCGMSVLLFLRLAAREEALEKSHRSWGGVQQNK